MISYGPLWKTLQEKKVSTYALTKKYHVSSSTLTRLRNNKPITTVTVNDLCRILHCDVSEIMQYIPEEDEKTL